MPGIASAATSVVLAHLAAGDDDHPGRGRRHHAAEPCALCHRRAVRNAGAALSRPHRPRTRPRPGHGPAHAARLAPPAGGGGDAFPRTSSNCRRSSPRPLPASASRPCRRPERRCRSGSSARAISARCSPPSSGCLTPSRRISRPTSSFPRWRSIAAASSRRSNSTGLIAMVGVNIIAADSDAEARRLATTQQMSFANIFRGARGLSQPPIDDIESYWSPMEKAQATRMLARSIVGSSGDGALRHRGARRGNRGRRTDRRLRRLRASGATALVRADRGSCSNGPALAGREARGRSHLVGDPERPASAYQG